QVFSREPEAARSEHPIARLSRSDQWSFADFRSYACAHALTGQFATHLPEKIDLAPLRDIFSRLRTLTLDGNERGRMGFVQLSTGKLVFGEMFKGNDGSVAITDRRPPGFDYRDLKAAVLLHSHPRADRHNSDRNDHFSAQDFIAFLQISDQVAS